MPRLTKSLVDKLQPRESRYDVQCDAIRGFVIRVNADGSRTAVFRYWRDGRRRRVTIGQLGPGFTFDKARRKAVSLRGQVQDGADPARERQQRRSQLTFAELAERHMAEMVMPYKAASTIVGYRSLMRRHLLPTLGRKRIDEIDRDTVMRLHARIGETTKGAANRARSLLSSVFTSAETWGLRPIGSNPCRATPKFRENKDERYLTAEERGRLEDALCQAEAATKGYPRYVAPGSIKAVRLLLLTGARRGEIVGLEWSMVDLDGPAGSRRPRRA